MTKEPNMYNPVIGRSASNHLPREGSLNFVTRTSMAKHALYCKGNERWSTLTEEILTLFHKVSPSLIKVLMLLVIDEFFGVLAFFTWRNEIYCMPSTWKDLKFKSYFRQMLHKYDWSIKGKKEEDRCAVKHGIWELTCLEWGEFLSLEWMADLYFINLKAK